MTNIKRRTWNEAKAAEKVGMVTFWLLIIFVVYWLLVHGSSSTQPPSIPPFKPIKSDTTYSSASDQALRSAILHIKALDKAMGDSAAILKRGVPQELGNQSRTFNELTSAGQAQFGSSVFEPLGQCFVAGVFASSWWQSQVHTTNNVGVEKITGSIGDALNAYQTARDQCLKSADPIAVAKVDAETDANLKRKFGGGKECLRVYLVDATTQETTEKPRPAHCQG